MFARIASLGALALLMTAVVPAAQAATFEAPVACAMPYQAAPYNGPLAQAQTTLDNLAACTYHTHDAPADLPVRILFVPYVPVPDLLGDAPTTEPNNAPPKESCLVQVIGKPKGEPHIQPFGGACRIYAVEPGPEPLDFESRQESRGASIVNIVALVPFYGNFEDAEAGKLFQPQPLPGSIKAPSFCKAQLECRNQGEPTMVSDEGGLLPADLAETLGFPMVCAQVYPYSLMCSVPNAAFEVVLTLLKA